jgi:15-cis-phytoene synthase
MRTRSPEHDHAADLAACRETLRGGSRTFFAASYVLPKRVRDPASALYAFCRSADDAVDLHNGKRAALLRLRERLDRAYSGRPLPTPVDRAFAEVVDRFAIPRALPEALLDGLSWDTEGRRYEDYAALTEYAVRVAGTVGAMMALLMDARSEQLVARACDLGVAMQLTNIARDVGEDAREGRLYLPLQWLRSAGVDPDEWLAMPAFDDAIGATVQRLLDEADVLYARSRSGIAKLPFTCRTGIHAARLLYAEIGREVERRGRNSVTERAVVPRRRKLRLLAASATASLLGEQIGDAAALPEARYLIEAVTAGPSPARSRKRSTNALATAEERLVWVIDLFAQLERRDQFKRSSV